MTIIVGYVHRPEVEAALLHAVDEARRRGAGLHLLHYLDHSPGESPTQVRHEAETSRATEDHLEQLRRRLVDDGLDATVEIVHGLPGGASQALLDTATRLEAELIVLGVRRRSKVEKLVMGSVAREVLLEAPCPVLTVKAAADE